MLRKIFPKVEDTSIFHVAEYGQEQEYLNLAYCSLQELTEGQVEQYGSSVTTLDLSNNSFTDLQSLYGFHKLHTLILDRNEITSHAALVSLPNLRMLSLNDNHVNNLSVFIEKVAKMYPGLHHLSLMKNEAAPSYFNGGTVQQYQDYRNFVISHFIGLKTLDDTKVDDTERTTAYRIYGRRWKRKKPKQLSVKSL